MWVPAASGAAPTARRVTHGGAESSCCGLSNFTQGFEVEAVEQCHRGIEVLNALGLTSDGSQRRREEIE